MEFFYFLFCLFCKLWVVRFCEYFLDLSFWFDEMYVTDWRGQWTRQLYPIYSHWREKEKKRFNPKEHLCCLQSNFRGKEFSLDVVVGPHLFIIGTNEFSRSFVSAIFQLNFAFGLNVCFFLFFWSKNKMKTDQMWWCHAGWMECRLYDSRVERKRVTSSSFEGRPFERGNG